MIKSTRGGKRSGGNGPSQENVFETEGGRYSFYKLNGEYYRAFELKTGSDTYESPVPERYDKDLWEEELQEFRDSKNSSQNKRSDLYETVETVNGYDIFRMKGTKGFYQVETAPNQVRHFRSKKAAKKFIETYLNKGWSEKKPVARRER